MSDGQTPIIATDSPLSPENYRYVYRDVKNDVQLASNCGGAGLMLADLPELKE